MQHINLLEPGLLAKSPSQGSGPVVALAVGLLALVAVHAGLEWHWLATAQRAAAAAASAATQAAPEAVANAAMAANGPGTDGSVQPSVLQQAVLREALLRAVQMQPKAPQAAGQTVQAIAAALPSSMWLTEIQLQGPRELRIAGGTLAPEALSQFASALATRLEALGLNHVALQTVQLEPAVLAVADANLPGPEQSTTPAGAGTSMAPRTLAMHHFVLASPIRLQANP